MTLLKLNRSLIVTSLLCVLSERRHRGGGHDRIGDERKVALKLSADRFRESLVGVWVPIAPKLQLFCSVSKFQILIIQRHLPQGYRSGSLKHFQQLLLRPCGLMVGHALLSDLFGRHEAGSGFDSRQGLEFGL